MNKIIADTEDVKRLMMEENDWTNGETKRALIRTVLKILTYLEQKDNNE